MTIGLVLAGIVLLLFLRSWRVTLVAMLAVPASLAASVLVLSVLGLSFNLMTLGGIAAAVGLVIDDAMVMIEHIARRAGAPARRRMRRPCCRPAREFLTPLSGSSLATIIVFLPLGFLSGVTGAFSRALSITMASALVFSWLFTAFALPVLARGIIDFERWHDPGHERRRLAGAPPRAAARPPVGASLARRAGAAAAAGRWAGSPIPTCATGFMPTMDEGGFVLDYRTQPGTSLVETDRELRQVEADPAGQPDGADLLAPHRHRPGRRPQRAERRRLLRPPETGRPAADRSR